MKIAIPVIAKNEDNYIDEWMDYHLKIGVTDFFIYQNDWRYNGKFLNDKSIHLFVRDGGAKFKQLQIWNDFIQEYYKDFDWAAFIDIDEFIAPKNNLTLNRFLINYSDKHSIQLHWRYFGDNHLDKVENNNYSCIDRFLMSEKECNKSVKTLINFNVSKQNIKMVNHWSDPFPFDIDPKFAEIAHYRTKTKEEYIKRKYDNLNGMLYLQNDIFKDFNNVIKWFNRFNKNEIKNTLIYDIYHKFDKK